MGNRFSFLPKNIIRSPSNVNFLSCTAYFPTAAGGLRKRKRKEEEIPTGARPLTKIRDFWSAGIRMGFLRQD